MTEKTEFEKRLKEINEEEDEKRDVRHFKYIRKERIREDAMIERRRQG